MPANVTIEFEKARLRYQEAAAPQAKLEALLEMQKLAPAHKGGENLRRDISRKIARLKEDIEKRRAVERKSCPAARACQCAGWSGLPMTSTMWWQGPKPSSSSAILVDMVPVRPKPEPMI